MPSQQALIKIRNNLSSTFSVFNDSFSVTRYVENKMKAYSFSGVYTDSRCEDILKDAIKLIEEDVNDKYLSIVKKINEFLDELIEISYDGPVPGNYSQDDFNHLAIGAGVGLATAIAFGGPIGWLVGIGLGGAALFNSSQKKKGLINRIVEIANKLNSEAIEKLESVLNKLIIPPPKAIKKKQKPVISDEAISSGKALTEKQLRIKNFLENKGIVYLVHFTDADNLPSIRKNNLLSVNEGKRRGVPIKIYDNGLSSHKIENTLFVDRKDYLCLSVTSLNLDLVRMYKYRHNINKVAVFYIDASILWKEINNDRVYCDRNASASSVKFGRSLEDFEKMFSEEISFITFDGGVRDNNRFVDGRADNETTNNQAEIWYYGSIDFEEYVKGCELR